MAISSKDSKILWANAAGRCSFPDCNEKLCSDQNAANSPHTIGEMAHIRGEKNGANRFDPNQPQSERNSYLNLILLCPNHHTLIDKTENEGQFSVEKLLEFKDQHESRISARLEVQQFANKYEVAAAALPFILQNQEVFLMHGPASEIARRNPHSDAHVLWLDERLSTIVPNNRALLSLVDQNKGLFSPQEQKVLSKFQAHVRSYERWVEDEVSYEGVVRFPTDFQKLIEELASASAQ